MENWKDIEGCCGRYQVSDMGNVRELCGGEFNDVPQFNVAHGYKAVHLNVYGIQQTRLVHRLVAIAFVPNPENKSDVNHKNEVATDNRVENLEWLSHRENLTYGTRVQRQRETLKKTLASRRGSDWDKKHRENLSKVRRGIRMFNNGVKNVWAFECPEGFVPGMVKRKRS